MEYSQNRFSLTVRASVAVVLLTLLIALPVAGQDQRTAGEALALELRANVVSLVADRSDGTHHGFGFIVGERAGQVLVVTANHVVRSRGPDSVAQIAVKYFHDQGKTYPATLLETSDQTYDLAVLQVPRPTDLTWRQEAMASQKAERGTNVWFVGRSGAWYVPTVAGRVNTLTLTSTYLVDNLPVRVGTSGAPLISEAGILGMITSDTSESSEAVSIDVMARAFDLWNLPWQLRPFRGTLGPATPKPPSPAASPAPEPPPPSITGKLCPTLSTGESGIELAVSGQGNEFRVFSGECIELSPGTYLLTEEDRDTFCLPYRVKVTAGETNYFHLTCR